MQGMKILIVVISAGGGHIALGEALREAYATYSKDTEVRVLDPFPKWIARAYRYMTTGRGVFIWKSMWAVSKYKTIEQIGRNINYKLLLRKRLFREISIFQPNVVISNNPMTINELSTLREEHNLHYKIGIQVADPFTPHKIWFEDGDIDVLLAPTPQVARQAIESGIPQDKVKTVGWLTRKEFLGRATTSSSLKKKLGLTVGGKIIFFATSGLTSAYVKEIVESIVTTCDRQAYKLLINTGDEKLQHIFTHASNFQKCCIVVPQVSDIYRYMALADIVMGKAGPNTLFEALHLQKPFFAVAHVPGQEDGNVRFIETEGVGWVEESLVKIAPKLKSILGNDRERKVYAARAKAVSKMHKDTARRIVAAISSIAD